MAQTDLSQKCYFSTIRAATNINLECVNELVEHFKILKQSKIVVEKQSKGVPCTHHVHMYLHYKSPIQIETVKKNIKKIVEKYHNPEKDGSVFRFMLKTNTCYVYKEYCDKYEDTDVYTGEFFDPELFSSDLPDEAMQTLLQAAVPTHTISHIWFNHEAKWREFSPNDMSVDGCHRYFAHRFFVTKDLDPVLDPRKLQHMIATLFRFAHKIVVKSRTWELWAENLQNELSDQNTDDLKKDNARKRARGDIE